MLTGVLAIIFGILGYLTGILVNWTIGRLMAGRKPFWFVCEHQSEKPRRQGSALVALANTGAWCPQCGVSLLLLPAFVEIAISLVFAGLWLRFGLKGELLLTAVYSSIFILIFATDLQWRLVPNKVVLPGAVFALFGGIYWHGLVSTLVGGAVGFAVLFVFYAIVPGGLGAGDVKLAGLIGLVTGWPLILLALIVGFTVGGVIAGLLLVSRRVGMRSRVPYAPFLVVGAMTAMLYGKEIMIWYLGRYI